MGINISVRVTEREEKEKELPWCLKELHGHDYDQYCAFFSSFRKGKVCALGVFTRGLRNNSGCHIEKKNL